MIQRDEIGNELSFLGKALCEEIMAIATLVSVKKNQEIIREGQYIRSIPIVQKGLIKVFKRHEDKELLLYYIQPVESCIMSFSASMYHEQSKIFALAEEESTLILIPSEKIIEWVKTYPSLNDLFYQQFNLRYLDLLQTIHHLLYDRLDKRLIDYLKEKVNHTKKNQVTLSHREIANELGTAREVITRLLKKLEKDQLIVQTKEGIKIL